MNRLAIRRQSLASMDARRKGQARAKAPAKDLPKVEPAAPIHTTREDWLNGLDDDGDGLLTLDEGIRSVALLCNGDGVDNGHDIETHVGITTTLSHRQYGR